MDRTKGRERVKNGLSFLREERVRVVTLAEHLFSPSSHDRGERSRLGNAKHRREFQGVEGLGTVSFSSFFFSFVFVNMVSLSFAFYPPMVFITLKFYSVHIPAVVLEGAGGKGKEERLDWRAGIVC